MKHQPQYQQNPSLPLQPAKSLLVRAIDWVAILLAIVISAFASPFLIKATQGHVVSFMTRVWWSDLGGVYALLWWIICHLFIFASSLVVLQVKLTSKITRLALKGFE